MGALNFNENGREVTFVHNWEINLTNVFRNEALTTNTKTEVQDKGSNGMNSKLLVGLKTSPIRSGGCGQVVRIYWTSLHKSSHPHKNLDACLVFEALNIRGNTWGTFKSNADTIHKTDMTIESSLLDLQCHRSFSTFKNSEGSWILKIKLTLKSLPDRVWTFNEDECRLAYTNKLFQKMSAFVDQKISPDVKIITKDNKELFAHKGFLSAQCPVFAAMFGSNFLENSTGVINVDDISAKTMTILMHFWYTGELLPSWKDDDTIVEFIYAAGKYQIPHVLKMLDTFLGKDLKTTGINIEILNMVQHLLLKNAETRILNLVIQRISQANNGVELLDAISLTTNSFD